ncbi:hypothetical protein AVEN_25469-1 [Araneus ventricosus]|uniref:Uncharacterized protein n=1 Tax=Araneus ventricosus TaxID=182803 RepID=A0A4Y2CTT7_ARAVE|nr:hypothetical protein AVEN_25469-1 [Araneus ventricosus]
MTFYSPWYLFLRREINALIFRLRDGFLGWYSGHLQPKTFPLLWHFLRPKLYEGLDGLMVRSRLLDQRAPSSNSDSTKDHRVCGPGEHVRFVSDKSLATKCRKSDYQREVH